WTDGNWIVLAVYMGTLASITVGATFLVPETRGRDLLSVQDALRLSLDESDREDRAAESAVASGSARTSASRVLSTPQS
ncbi:MAG: hypothetical protein ACTH6N_07500, partial [Brachybacterium tyrofermentans]